MRLVLVVFLLAGCAALPTEADDIAEMWAFAREHRSFEREDSKQVRYVQDPAAECTRLRGYSIRGERGCTPIAPNPVAYSILSLTPTAMEIAHEASHRVYGDWHPGYAYFTQRELAVLRR